MQETQQHHYIYSRKRLLKEDQINEIIENISERLGA